MKFDKSRILTAAGVVLVAAVVLSAVFPSCKKEGGTARPLADLKGVPRLMTTGTGSVNGLARSAKMAAPRMVEEAAVTYDAVAEMESDAGVNFAALNQMAAKPDSPTPANPSTGSESATQTKKLIRTGNVNLEVESLAQTMNAVNEWVKSFGGYISNTNESSRNLYVTAHVPADKFDEAMNQTGNFGKIVSKNVNSRDVTEQYYDLSGRLETQKTLLEKMQGYLKNAKNMDEILRIESKISSVTNEIESMTGRLKRLSNQIDFAEISLSATLPVNQSESGFILPDTKSEFREFIGNILAFFSHFIFAVLAIVIYGIPLVLLLLGLYWIAFGKIGLVKKLFNKIK